MSTDPFPADIYLAGEIFAPAIPLGAWADRNVESFFASIGTSVPSGMDGAILLVERASIKELTVPAPHGSNIQGVVSAGGGCRMIPTLYGGWVALNLARDDDRELLPALFCDEHFDTQDYGALETGFARLNATEAVVRGREMGLAIASIDEYPASNGIVVTATGSRRTISRDRSPLVIDLSALWSGPLAAHLLWCAGAQVVKVESRNRPDSMRDGDPSLFALINQGKASVTVDLHDPADRAALISLIERADIVIEAARPRALRQLGIDADAIVARTPGLVWLTITGHGASQSAMGDAADWVGFGDDCGVAGGLSAALREATGQVGFVGDAIADPISGIAAARTAWDRWSRGEGARIILSMSAVVRAALDHERHHHPATLHNSLKHWVAAHGRPIATRPIRTATAPVAPFGRDSSHWLSSMRNQNQCL